MMDAAFWRGRDVSYGGEGEGGRVLGRRTSSVRTGRAVTPQMATEASAMMGKLNFMIAVRLEGVDAFGQCSSTVIGMKLMICLIVQKIDNDEKSAYLYASPRSHIPFSPRRAFPSMCPKRNQSSSFGSHFSLYGSCRTLVSPSR